MKHGTVAAALAAALLLAPVAAEARQACMAAPIAGFEGERAVASPDGRMLVLESDAALRILALPSLTPLASYPRPPGGPDRANFGFTADKKRLWLLRQDGNQLGIVFLDLGAPLPPALPPSALTFSGVAERDPVQGAGSFVIAADRTQKVYPKPGSLAYDQNYIGTILTGRLLRTSDGSVVTRFDHMAEYSLAGSDTAQHRLILSYVDDPTDGTSIHYLLVDAATGQQRALRDESFPQISPDGGFIVWDDWGGKAMRVEDAATGALIGAVSGNGQPVISADSGTILFMPYEDIPAQALRRGAWGTPVAVPGLAGVARVTSVQVEGNRLLYGSDNGEIGLVDLGSLQRVWTIPPPFGPDYAYAAPRFSPGLGRVAAYFFGKEDARRFLVADGATGRVLCQGALPNEGYVGSVTATHLVTGVLHEHRTTRSALYAIEDEASARAKTERAVAEARARSAKLSPAKRAEAQQTFKQAFELFRSGEFDAASRLFESGLASDPGNAAAQYYLGETYARAGKKEQALAHYELAAGLAPSSKEGALAASRLGD